MTRIKTEIYRPDAKLIDTFKTYTKGVMRVIVGKLGLIITPPRLCKKEYAEAVAKAVIESPNLWLSKLPYYELVLLKRLVEAGPNQHITEPIPLGEVCLRVTGLALFDEVGCAKNRARIMICNELRNAVAPFLDDYLTSPVYAHHYQIEQLVLGVLNLYGILPIQQLGEMVENYGKDISLSALEVEEYMDNSILVNSFTIFVDDDDGSCETNVISPFIYDPEILMMQIDQRDVRKLKKFTAEEVMAAGTQPFPLLINPETSALRTLLLQDLSRSADEAEYTLHRLWQHVQLSANFRSMIDTLTKGRMLSKPELQHCIRVFANYNNHCPRWYLKGGCPADVSLQMSEFWSGIMQKESLYPDLFTNKEAGRNDPCPCGSGKKYKKCCGKN